MPDYKKRFDEHSPAAIAALTTHGAAISRAFFGMHANHVRRLIERLSVHLGKVDKSILEHPEYLAGPGYNYVERAIHLVSNVPSALNDNGIDHFLVSTLPEMVDVERRIALAIGVGEVKTAEIKSVQIRAIDKFVDYARQRDREINTLKGSVQSYHDDISGKHKELLNSFNSSMTDVKKIREYRKVGERLTKGGPNTPPLSELVDRANASNKELVSLVAGANAALAEATSNAAASGEMATQSQVILSSLKKTDETAKQILNNATQAGLAGAYKVEREKLARQQMSYAIVFYGIIVSVILYAAFFIIPIASQLILSDRSEGNTIQESALLLFVRVLIVLPALWALLFTNRRFVYLETLQMDYAAKAVTALAYSGYRDEMNEDVSLAKRLKDGVIARFVEHPSRLLGAKVESSVSVIDEDGARVVTETRSPDMLPAQPNDHTTSP